MIVIKAYILLPEYKQEAVASRGYGFVEKGTVLKGVFLPTANVRLGSGTSLAQVGSTLIWKVPIASTSIDSLGNPLS